MDATAAKVYDNSDLVFEEGTTKAMCPWCGEVKEWTAISEDLTTTLTLSANGHYYLAKDLQNTSRINVASESVACMHLNGHNITTTGNRAISVQKDGLLSVMGNGIVSGSGTAESTYGATVSCAGSMNLIGGTYKHFDSTLPTVSQNRATGTANIYQDVTFQADENVTGSHVFLAFGTLNVYGTTISGGVPGSLTDGKGGNIAAMATVANATTEVHLYDAVIDGGIYMANKTYTVLTLNGTVKVSNKDGGITTDELLTLGQMKKGAEVFVTAADGAFTVASDRAADYLAYGWIKPADETKTITENAGVLSIG